MPAASLSPEQKILAAAEVVFHEHGFRGARTSLIADKAQVSRTLVHYYFRTKGDLFREVLRQSFGAFIQRAQQLFTEHADLRTLVDNLVDLLCDVLRDKPGLPSFIVNLLNESPELIIDLPVVQAEQLPRLLDRLLERARTEGGVRTAVTGEDLLLNIYGLCVIPYLSAPLIRAKEGRSTAQMEDFMEQRRARIKNFVWNGIQG